MTMYIVISDDVIKRQITYMSIIIVMSISIQVLQLEVYTEVKLVWEGNKSQAVALNLFN